MNNFLTQTDLPISAASSVKMHEGIDLDIQSRLNKARNSLNMMNEVWPSSTYSTRTKLKLYHSCVLTTLQYGSECWRLTQKDLSKPSTFHTKSLRRIPRTFWPNVSKKRSLWTVWNWTNGYHPDEKTMGVDWPGHSSRSFHCKNCFTLDARRETQEEPPQDHMATDSGQRIQGDGEDLGRHQACCIHLHIHHMSRILFLILSFLDFVAFVLRTLIFP